MPWSFLPDSFHLQGKTALSLKASFSAATNCLSLAEQAARATFLPALLQVLQSKKLLSMKAAQTLAKNVNILLPYFALGELS